MDPFVPDFLSTLVSLCQNEDTLKPRRWRFPRQTVSSSDFSYMTVLCEGQELNWSLRWWHRWSSWLVIVTDCELHSWLFKHFFSRENQHHQDLISKTTTCNALQWQWQWHVGNTLKSGPRNLWSEGRPDPQTTQKSKSLEPQEVQPPTIKKNLHIMLMIVTMKNEGGK